MISGTRSCASAIPDSESYAINASHPAIVIKMASVSAASRLSSTTSTVLDRFSSIARREIYRIAQSFRRVNYYQNDNNQRPKQISRSGGNQRLQQPPVSKICFQ